MVFPNSARTHEMQSSPGQARSSSNVFRTFASSPPARPTSLQGSGNLLSRVNRHSGTGVRASQMRRASSTVHSMSSSVRGQTPSELSSTTSQPKTGSCFVCQRISPVEPTSLITCSKCRRKYHRGCHKPVVREDPKPDWRCYRCPVPLTKTTMSSSDNTKTDRPPRKKTKPSPLNDGSGSRPPPRSTRDKVPETLEEKLSGPKATPLQQHAKPHPGPTRSGPSSKAIRNTTSLSPAASLKSNDHSLDETGKESRHDFFTANLAAMALLGAPHHRLDILQIYKWVSEHVPGYDMKDTRWQDEMAVALTLKSKGSKPVFERFSKDFEELHKVQWALRQGAERSLPRWDSLMASVKLASSNAAIISNEADLGLAKSANSKRKRSELHDVGDVDMSDGETQGQESGMTLHAEEDILPAHGSQPPAPPSPALTHPIPETAESIPIAPESLDMDILNLSQTAKNAELQVAETEQLIQEKTSRGEPVLSSLHERHAQEKITSRTARERLVVAVRARHDKNPFHRRQRSPELGTENGSGGLRKEMGSKVGRSPSEPVASMATHVEHVNVPNYCDATTQTIPLPEPSVDTNHGQENDCSIEGTRGPRQPGDLEGNGVQDDMEGVSLGDEEPSPKPLPQLHMYNAVKTIPQSRPPTDPDEDLKALLKEQSIPKFTASTRKFPFDPRDIDTHQQAQKMREIRARPTRKQIFGKPEMSRLTGTSSTDRLGTLKLGARYAEEVPLAIIKRKKDNELKREDLGQIFDTVEELLGMPERVIPMTHETQLAFRDFTPTTTGRVGRPKVIYKVGQNAKY